ncbi:hypothetical protein HRI_002454900 [Hibiscus trionum]|uniref:fructose-bisphosphate aldolase n=1 Tax=Hibiscus trionum TaxID=183268 RepID=A0A9W7I2R1_HIBTR|nr:hypothetical protein HRI_002454900 [Hibiscus trionum]
MACATFVKLNAASFYSIGGQKSFTQRPGSSTPLTGARRVSLPIRAGSYTDELIKTAKSIASPGRGILAIDESNATCGKRLSSIGLDNTEPNRQAYRQLLLTTPGLGEYISGAILFEETLYQSTTDGKKFVDVLRDQKIVPGIKVDKGLVPLPGSNNESWCQGLDGWPQDLLSTTNTVLALPSGGLLLAFLAVLLLWLLRKLRGDLHVTLPFLRIMVSCQ